MIEPVVRALERLPIGVRRGLALVLPLLVLGIVAAGFTLALTGGVRQGQRSSSSSPGLLPPTTGGASSTSTSTGAVAPSPSATPASGTTGGHRARDGGGPPRSPERRPSPQNPVGRMLAVAQQFSVAYMPYQVGQVGEWVRRGIEKTCASAFARYLLAQPPELSAQQRANPNTIPTYRVLSVFPIRLGKVQVNYASEQHNGELGAFLLTLIDHGGRWLVSHLEP